MATAHGKLTTVLANEFDLSSRVSQASVSWNQQAVSVTGMGVDDEELIAGLRSGSLTGQGAWDDAAGQNEALFNAELGNDIVWTVAIGGGDASGDIGNRTLMIDMVAADWNPRSVNNDAVRWSGGGPSANTVRIGGRLLHPVTAETTTGNYASSDWGAGPTTNGAVAHLHVTAFTGTNATITVEDSANDSTFANLGTFASVTGVGSERLAIAGNVERYVRAAVTVDNFTSMTFAVSLARSYSS